MQRANALFYGLESWWKIVEVQMRVHAKAARNNRAFAKYSGLICKTGRYGTIPFLARVEGKVHSIPRIKCHNVIHLRTLLIDVFLIHPPQTSTEFLRAIDVTFASVGSRGFSNQQQSSTQNSFLHYKFLTGACCQSVLIAAIEPSCLR